MPISIGQCRTDPPTGISARAFDAFVARGAYNGALPSVYTPATAPRDMLAALLESAAAAIYDTIKVDASFTVTVPKGAFGPGIPPAPVVLTVNVT